MAIQKEGIIDIDLSKGQVFRSFINKVFGSGDKAADVIGMRITNEGASVSLVGASCVGYFIRADGITLIISGTVSGDTAYVVLPEAAYAVEGQFTLSIKVSGTGFINTMRIVDGTIVKTTTGELYDPSSQVPSVEQYEQDIAAAREIADDIDAIHISNEVITGTRYKIIVTKDS